MRKKFKYQSDMESNQNGVNTLMLEPTQTIDKKNNPNAGYGKCKACDCKGYISKHNDTHECKVCGHHYDRHYSA